MGVAELNIKELDFEAVARLESGPELKLTGSADSRFVEALESLVTALHDEVRTAGGRQVAVDIRRLEFMNASCFNVFVNWLGLVNDLEPDQRYELKFSTNPAIPWQRRSLRTLSCFATDLVVLA